ncbi:(2R)-3-sulfolactate dehydrogenase (NADP(+)) [Hartmannibacter diazotrophicus]|uniref:(2R)-3-sulfolactate dehydrogenase (NADP(+)) n=1 Tax=Hartmannibacter diazotrophicus TaxID=1482074 RepID=A0A2C9D806_9HYPH|nr:Ldh family oxidoreductase [Hartmannibacter diazotrophicus]SON56310.1 (2R)-3-sulfolactate dehydrogenase (NADP(+)) [Hartmannibacter diazotrophicus]
MRRLSLEAAHRFASETLQRFDTAPDIADCVAKALVEAEASGLKGHGLVRLESYSIQTRVRKIDGHARPLMKQAAPGLVAISAEHGFSYPAVDLALDELKTLAPAQGIAMAGINKAGHCGAIGLHVEKLAEAGLVAMMFCNAPASIAPWGGKRPLYGTNPIAFATPAADRAPIVVDLSVAKVARGKVLAAAQRGDPIPEGWAVDAAGNPTTDAKAALGGTMLPMGDAKGTALALMVEVFSSALVSARFSTEQPSYFNDEGGPPEAGHAIIAVDPSGFAPFFIERMGELAGAIEAEEGARLPGSRRLEARRLAATEGLVVDASLDQALDRLARESIDG